MRKTHLISLAFLSGTLLSFPWITQWGDWVLFFAFTPLFFAETFQVGKVNLRDSLHLTYPAFFTWNILSTWWIGYVSLPGMLFIVAANALLMSLVWWAAAKVKSILGLLSGYFSLIIFWISFEFVGHRGILPWPWLTLGNGFANSIHFIQWYEFTGVLGGSFWVLLVNILIFETLRNLKRFQLLEFVRQLALLLIVVFLPAGLSYYLYFNYSESGETCHAVALQPNFDPYTEKFNAIGEKEQIQRLAKLAEQSMSNSTDLVLTPETAFPVIWEDSLWNSNEEAASLKKLIQLNPKVNFIVGAITKIRDTNSSISAESYKSFNSAILISDLQNPQISHKTILVAGVEKVPLREYVRFFSEFLIDPGGSIGELTPGEAPDLLKMKNGELVAPIICFESVFGDYVRQQVLKGASYLVVLTNDGWWKHSIGVWQHFGYSRIRAIETRRSVIRSANTGISGGINQRGDILSQSKIAVDCAVKCNVTLDNRLTFYVVYGDYIGKISLLFSFFVAFYVLAYRRTLKT